jgi:hypothetical protein
VRYSIAGNFNYEIYQMVALDPEKRIFVFKIVDLRKIDPTFLRMMDLSGETSKTIMEKDVGQCGIVARNHILFVWQENIMYAMNSKFELVNHPLVTIFNKEKPKDYGLTVEIAIHPTLPFAIIIENKFDKDSNYTTSIWSISWRESDLKSDKPKMIKILSEDSLGYSFSYDGKWVWLIDASTSPKSLILMPVDPSLPYFLGKPIYLGQLSSAGNNNGDAMTRNPSGLVVSGCDGYDGPCWLKKWDFTEAEKLIEKPNSDKK